MNKKPLHLFYLARGLAAILGAGTLLIACGGGGDGGGGDTAPASAGFVVAARVNPRQIDIYRVDQPNVPVETIPNARFTSGTGMFDNTGKRVGTHWGIPSSTTIYQTELGIFTTSQAVVLGSEAGHEYEYLGYIASTPPRVFFRDFTSLTNISIHSAHLDGTDSRELLAGCVATSLVVPRPDGGGQIASAQGFALRCDKGTGNKIYYSDGMSPAIELPGTTNREPKVLTSTHLVLYNSSLALPALFTQSLTAPFTETKLLLVGNSVDSDEVHVNPAGIAWVRTFTAANARPHQIWVIDTANPANLSSRFDSFEVPLWEAMSADGLRFATVYQKRAGAGSPDESWILPFAIGPASPVVVTPGTGPTLVSDINFLENGKILVTRGVSPPTGIFLHDADGSNEVQKGVAGLRVAAGGIRGEQALFTDLVSGDLQSVELAFGGGLWTMENAAAAPVPSFVSPLGATTQYVTYVNDANEAWIATADPDLGIKQRIDLIPTNLVSKVGEGPGNRIFLSLRREQGITDQSDIVMVDLDTLVTTPIVSGSTTDFGLHFPN